MANIKQLVENKTRLDYPALCKALIEQFGVSEPVNWDSILPAPQQQELFGGEVLRYVETHPQLASQKDIRPITLKKGSTSQMLFFFVCLADSSLPKKQIEQITKRFIKGTDANRYIIWFFGNKEATELKVVLSAREGKKIVLKTLPFGIEQPYYKTYDYILTEVAAKVQQLFVEPTDLWKALWEAFDISIVNRRFYDEIKQAFDFILLQINKKGNPFKTDEDRAQFAIRLLGRIIFCWFLKRKNILKEDALSSKAVLNYKNKDYYHELLEPLFFEVMNKPEKERIGGLPKIIAHYPFLNGGLFDANKETDFYDADTSTPDFRLSIENDWFYNFFSITLERYNFTVDENSSSNAEIAIDPEMLGRIFENLLAEQNPETGESARKATGSFCTPREIVDYMVEQSITEYLKTALGNTNDEPALERNLFGVIPNQQLKLREAKPTDTKLNEALEDFVHTSHLPDELKPQAQSILDALNIIKVLDPACGSGAFPIGILQKLIALKQEIVQVQNPKKQITQTAAYKLKLGTIQNSIYGVDIQPMAVELSRLRCWLSLVVDEENDNIKALPNLNFKFVCADSLVDVPDNEYVKIQSKKALEEFTNATEQYFNPDYKQKTGLKVTIKRCLNEITNIHDVAINQIITQLRKERNSASISRLKQLEKSLQDYTKQQSVWHSYRNIFENKKVDFFNTQYFFPLVKAGFDVVIGNPPYGITYTEDQIKDFRDNFKVVVGHSEAYYLFIERGIKLLSPKAVLTYITPNAWLSNKYAKGVRKLILNESQLLVLLNLNKKFVFENAGVETSVFLVSNTSNKSFQIIVGTDIEKDKQFTFDTSMWYQNENLIIGFSEDPIVNTIFSKVKSVKSKLSDLIDLSNGFKPYQVGYGKNLSGKTLTEADVENRIYHSDKKINDNYKKQLKGKNVNKYHLDWTDGYIKWGDWLMSPKESKYFENPKILIRQIISDTLLATLDENKYYADQSLYIAITYPHKDISLKYCTALLNSKLIGFYFRKFYSEEDALFPKIKVNELKDLPLKEVKEDKQTVIGNLVDYVINIKKQKIQLNEYVPNEHIAKQFEELIDACVYELYFDKEVKAKEADVLKLVAEQFKPIDSLKEPEQIKIIQDGYQILRDSNSEIRSRITRQKLVEEIAIIQTSTQ